MQTDERLEKLYVITKKDIISFIEEAYGITPSKDPSALKGGTESFVWLIQDKSKSYILKIYGDLDCSFKRVQEEGELYRYLNNHKINAPVVFSTSKGVLASQFAFRGEEFPAILMKYEELQEKNPRDITDNEIRKIGRTVAQMHLIFLNYPKQSEYPEFTFPDWLLDIDIRERVKDSPNLDKIDNSDIRFFLDSFDRLDAYKEKYKRFKNLSRSIIHKDLALEHTPFLPNNEVYIFDFADRMYGPVSHEIGVMLTHYFRADDISFARWEHLKNILISSYRRGFKLTSDDINIVPLTITLRIFISSLYLIELAKKIDKMVDISGVKRRIKLLRYISKHYTLD